MKEEREDHREKGLRGADLRRKGRITEKKEIEMGSGLREHRERRLRGRVD